MKTMDGVQKTTRTVLVLYVTAALLLTCARGLSTKGNEFYFAFMGNDEVRGASDQNAILFVTTEETSPVQVTVEVNPAFYQNNPNLDTVQFPQTRTQTVVAGTSVAFNFSVSAETPPNGGFPDQDIRVYDLASSLDRSSGIKVSTDGGQISVYGINNEISSVDAFSVYPCHEYPTIPANNDGERFYEYVILSTTSDPVTLRRDSRLMIVGCQDDTDITITPLSQLNTLPANLPPGLGNNETPSPSNPLEITIDILQTYLLGNLEDLSGTRVRSDKPIALFGGHECARVPGFVLNCDYLVQQIPPEPTWGDRFFIIPVPERYSGDFYRAATTTSDTVLSVTCRTLGDPSPSTVTHAINNEMRWVEFNTAAATSRETRVNEIQWCSVESNHPVLLIQYAQGSTADASQKDIDRSSFGDPFMTIVPPVTQYANDFTVPTAKRLRASPLFPSLTIAIPQGDFFRSPQQDQTRIRLNSETVEPDEGWVEIFCSDGQVCGYGGRIGSAPEGTVTIEHTTPEAGIAVWVYGIASSVSFGMTAGFRLDPIAFPNLRIVEDVTVTESDAEAVVRIIRTGDLSGGSRFNLRIEDGGATRGVDYSDYTVDPSDSIRTVINATTNEIRMRSNIEEVTFRFPILNDTLNEGTEKFFLHITPIRRINAVLTPTGTVTILDSGLRIQFGLTDCSFSRSESDTVSINVIRFAGLSQNGDIVADITPMTFSAHESMGRSIPSSYQQYDPAEPTDFDTTNQRITFTRGGESEMTVQITTFDDDIKEFDEAFVVVLNIVQDGGNTIQPPEAGRDVVVCTIRDDEDSVNIELDPTSVDLQEGDVAVGISVTKSAVSECSLQSVLSIDDAPDVDRALEGQDFVIDSLDVIIPAFETANSIPISGIAISDDSLPEVTEGFRVSLSFKDFDTTCSEQNCSRCDCCRTAAVQNIFTIATTVSTVVTIQDNDDICAPNPCNNGGICDSSVVNFTCECVAGYTGELCETDIDECAPNTCQNGGTCTDGIDTVTCDCVAGYTGELCETDINECAPNPCQNGGTCTDGIDTVTCDCIAGYTGGLCETDIDDCVPNPCQNGGTCTDGVDTVTCDCVAGYTGELCETDINECDPNPCQNGGTCTDGIDTVTCDCIAGYTGELCETDIDDCVPNPCQNGGTCTDGVDSLTCECVAGYTGELCETDIDECAPNPCQNGGTCTDGIDTLTCDCVAGYTGELCETDINECAPNPCQNGGSCTDGINTLTCDCVAGYTGELCDIDISECDPNPCQNGGTCTDGINTVTCDCISGYTGELCETDIDDCAPNPCQNGGTCTDGIDTLTCDCVAGYTGELCETDIDECTPNPCQNGGTCTDGINTLNCDCIAGYTGELCETDIDDCAPNPCQNGGTCTDGVGTLTCDCVAGYTGELCETDIDDCAPNPCQNGGTCTDGINTLNCDCIAGYTGELCETDIDDCAPNPCQNGGTCTDGIDTLTCDCVAGYTGELCETDIDECAPNPCQNGGTCTDGINTLNCDCIAGYTGELCETDIDDCAPNPCQNGGTCTDGVGTLTCDCVAGYTGDLCETDIDDCAPNPCQNGGTCTDGINTLNCDCIAGYTGELCETDIDDCAPNPCQNGGTCTDGVNTLTCDCVTGYTGELCDIDISECDPNPCQNGGTCTDGINTVTCDCIAGYTGELCETDIDDCVPNPCQNGGTCTDGINSLTCDCVAGYTGELCEIDINECAPNPCQNGGTCTDGVGTLTCDCVAGYTGELCETDIDDCAPNPCQNGGTCTDGVDTVTCDCVAGYTGELCETDIDDCAPNPCQNGGTCTDGIDTVTCDCVAGYTGELCETDIDDCAPNPCQNGGTCTDGVDTVTCDCVAGYTGELCETDIDDCAPNPCQNGGTCTDGIDTVTCDCVAGYTGELCETDIDDCAPNPCQNGGTCTDGVNTVTCDCVAGYTGELCETDIDDCAPNPCQNGGTCTDGIDTVTCDCVAGYTGELCETDIDDCVPNPCQNGGTCTDGVDTFICNCAVGYTGAICDVAEPRLPPQPDITDVSLIRRDDLHVRWRLSDGIDLNRQPVDNYTVEVRCVSRVDSESVAVSELLERSVAYRDAVTANTEFLFSDIELRNKTYLVRVCAQNSVGETCSGYEIFTPPLPPRPEITSVSLEDGDDLDIRWRLPVGATQPVDIYIVEVRCVGRVDSESVAVSELLERSVFYRDDETTNTEVLFSDIELRNKTYLIRVCAQSGVGETCSGYEIFTPPLPPRPEITDVSLVDDDDLGVKWRLPDGVDTTEQPVDNYAVEVRCVDRLESEERRDVDVAALLADSAAYRNEETEDTEIIFTDVDTNNKTYIIRVCAQSRVGMTCSEYEIFTPPVSSDSSDLPPGIIVVIVILVILGCCCCWLCLLILFFWCLRDRDRQGNYYPYKREKKYRQQYAGYREEEEDSEDFEEDIDVKA